jgi:5'-methylthioadenosine phosphorylase
MSRPPIGVIGGSGFYSLFDAATSASVHTPYGAPSGRLTTGDIAGAPVVFLPRHGPGHEIPPHRINYRANLWALKEAGCDAVIAPSAAGSLRPSIHPGDFVVCDQFVDRTNGRVDTFYDGPLVVHASTADPYCPALRAAAVAAAGEIGVTVHDGGTVVVVQGPRFSTRAESAWFRSAGWDVINMTQYPEVALARELEMCFVNISLVTDYDTGLEGEPGVETVTYEAVIEVLARNNASLRRALAGLVARITPDRTCTCRSALQGSHS